MHYECFTRYRRQPHLPAIALASLVNLPQRGAFREGIALSSILATNMSPRRLAIRLGITIFNVTTHTGLREDVGCGIPTARETSFERCFRAAGYKSPHAHKA
jgi:hypothetical protein